jgi:NADPH-dependent curcumin reductase CurA
MAPTNNTSAIFNEVPHGFPVVDKTIVSKTESIDLENVQLNGGTLVKTLYLSIDPYLRNVMREGFQIGKPCALSPLLGCCSGSELTGSLVSMGTPWPLCYDPRGPV